MIRPILAAILAIGVVAGPTAALAQATDMTTYGDTMRKTSGKAHPVALKAGAKATAKHAGHAKGGSAHKKMRKGSR